VTGERFTLDPSIKALLKDLGVSRTRVLRRAKLPTDLFGRGPVDLPPEEYFRLWEALDAEGEDPDLAVAIGRSISVEMFTPPIFAALCSPDLGTAARRIAIYKPLIGPMRLEVDQGDEGLTLSFRWPPGMTPPRLLAATELVFWVALARIATRHHVRPVRVSDPWLSANHAGLDDYFGVNVHNGPAHAITFASNDASRPFLTENDQLWRFFAPELRKRLSDLQATASVADRVRAALRETLPAGGSSMTAVTRHLAVSNRTLQRQLRLEGTTFQEVLATTREGLARHYLSHSTMRTAEIAYLLGYDDTNSFYRAFRVWTGTTPDGLRALSS
jgi:AraC-like DNA-binding protein